MKTYDVMREHEADRFYRTGDTREVEPSTVAHLVALGVLVERVAEAPPHRVTKSKKVA